LVDGKLGNRVAESIRLNGATVTLISVLLISAFVYSNTLQDQFVWDDKDFILNWQTTRDLRNIPTLLAGATPPTHEGVFRPLRGVFYAVSYQLYGLNPVGYRVQAIIVHLMCTALVYMVTYELLRKADVAFLTSLVFGVHPVHTEAVSFTTTTFDLIGTVFFLISFLLYMRSRKVGGIGGLMSLGFAMLAFLTDEFTYPLPLVVLLYELCMVRPEERKIKAVLPYFAMLGLFLFLRFFILNIGARKPYPGGSVFYTMLTMTRSFKTYVLVTLLPVSLSTDHVLSPGITAFVHDESAILAQKITDPDVLLSMITLLLVVLSALVCRRRWPLACFAIGWFLVCLIPASNIIPQAALIRERYLYLPSYGFCLLFASLAYRLLETAVRKADKTATLAILLTLLSVVVGFSYLTLERNRIWTDELTLWTSTASDTPLSSYAYYNLGVTLSGLGRWAESVKAYERAVEVNPKDRWSYLNLGTKYDEAGQIDVAMRYYRKALDVSPGFAEAHYDLAAKLHQQKKFRAALKEYREAIKYKPNFALAYYNIGNLYLGSGDLQAAIAQYNISIYYDPDYPDTYNNLGIAYVNLGMPKEAEAAYKKALELGPNSAQTHRNLGNLYAQEGREMEANAEYRTEYLLLTNPPEPSRKEYRIR